MEIRDDKIKVIAFDADDTLWVNEPYFREAETEVAKLLAGYETINKIQQEIYKMEMHNLQYYGYGVRPFILSMIYVLGVVLLNPNFSSIINVL